MIRSIPSSLRKPICDLCPVARTISTWFVNSYHVVPVVESAGLYQSPVRHNRGRGAPHVGENHEGADGVVSHVVFDRVRGAVVLQRGVVQVVAASSVGQGDVGATEVGSVKDNYSIGVEELHVHGGYADVGEEEVPFSGGGVGQNIPVKRWRDEEEEEELGEYKSWDFHGVAAKMLHRRIMQTLADMHDAEHRRHRTSPVLSNPSSSSFFFFYQAPGAAFLDGALLLFD